MDEVNNLTKVLEFLYLGDLDNSLDRFLLEDEGITHVLSVLDGSKKKYSKFKYYIIDIKDYPWVNISKYFSKAVHFIHKARMANTGCLVHCGMGISRSVTIILAYLVTTTRLPWQQCLQAIQGIRPEAGPNSGFIRQLTEYQDSLAQKPELWEQYADHPLRYDDIRAIKQMYNIKNNGVPYEVYAKANVFTRIPGGSSRGAGFRDQVRDMTREMRSNGIGNDSDDSDEQ